MCEITNGKIYVADRDLVCYKVMFENGNILQSACQGYEYEIGREYCEKAFEYRCLTDDVIYEAWYKVPSSFAGMGKKLYYLPKWEKNYTIYPNMYLNRIETDLRYSRCGFYSYTYYGNSRMESYSEIVSKIYGSDRIKCVRCRIPEGSKYMVSDNGEVFVSERIVIDNAWSLDV
jgi:hypothetical protein